MSASEGSLPRLFGAPSTPQLVLHVLESPPVKSCLDPKGDLCIQVGEAPATSFIVCSRTLARTSSFWNTMLYGEFKESKKFCPENGLEWMVELPDDDPRPMALLLNIVHCHFDVVPSYPGPIGIQDLYEISVLTDKYDMTHTLRPWARGWLHSIMDSLGEMPDVSLREQYCQERLWISWELGDKAGFEGIAIVMLLNSSASTEDANSLRCDGVLEPPDIYKILEQTRLNMIKEILTSLNHIIQGLIQNEKIFCEKYKEKSKKKIQRDRGDCLASMLGAGIQSLHSTGLWPIPQPTDVQWSVSYLSEKLRTVEIQSNIGEHHTCSQKRALQAGVENVLHSIPSLLTEVHYGHLDSQARRSGISPTESDGIFDSL
ncbi:hypothetical protein F5B21DRAFT_481523 [Xylaria acuta]|nr:hypothetical protein F5B21DRAFT_481523 [Xylaria acuta]